jgi:hypothetical protein
MMTRETLEEMVRKQLKENAREILDIHYKAQEFLTDEEFDRFSDLRTAKKAGERLSREQRNELQSLLRAVATRERQSFAGTELDPAQAGEKALAAKGKLMPPALKALGKRVPDEHDEVDPYARTQSAHSLGGTTAVVPRLKKENKIITQSYLRQLIKEELEVILTDDEVKEMFGIDITEKKEGLTKIKI